MMVNANWFMPFISMGYDVFGRSNTAHGTRFIVEADKTSAMALWRFNLHDYRGDFRNNFIPIHASSMLTGAKKPKQFFQNPRVVCKACPPDHVRSNSEA